MPNTGLQAPFGRLVLSDGQVAPWDVNALVQTLINGTFGMPLRLTQWDDPTIYQQHIRPLDDTNGLAQLVQDNNDDLIFDLNKNGINGGKPTTLYPSLAVKESAGGTANLSVTSSGATVIPSLTVKASSGGTTNLLVNSSGVSAVPKLGVNAAVGTEQLFINGKTKGIDLWMTDHVGIGQDINGSEALAVTGHSQLTGDVLVTGNVAITIGLIVDTTTLVVDAANNRVGILTATPGGTMDVAGVLRVSGSVGAPTTGAGMELTYLTGISYVVSFDHSLATYMPLHLDGFPVIVGYGPLGTVGFFGHATGTTQPTITGSRGGNAALASLLTALAAMGLIVNSSS